jgi:hypothetical protein
MARLIIETYFAARMSWTGWQHDSATFFVRGHDWARGWILSFNSIMSMALFSSAAGDVGYEGFGGFEIIRRKTLGVQKTDAELYFLMSMYASYTSPGGMNVRGSRYIIFDRIFTVGTIGAFFTYFVFATQFAFTFDYSGINNLKKTTARSQVGYFIHRLEDDWQHGELCKCWYPNISLPHLGPGSALDICEYTLKGLGYTMYNLGRKGMGKASAAGFEIDE